MELLDGFFLGELRIDPSTGTVSSGAGSEHLTPHAVEVLLCIARRPRELVSREIILAEAWGHGQGNADAVSRVVSEIRHALGDHADTPSFIQTVPKRGYRLLVQPAPGLAHYRWAPRVRCQRRQPQRESAPSPTGRRRRWLRDECPAGVD